MSNSAADNAARALLAGPFVTDRLATVLADCRGSEVTAGLRGLASALSKKFGEGKRPRLRKVSAFLAARRDFPRWFRDGVPDGESPAAMNPAAAILIEEGFSAAHRKTRIMPGAVSQRAAGLVLNHSPALPRSGRDTLKAILTNCLNHGPASQNRAGHPDFRAHLQGRLAHATHTHPSSAAKLRALFESIPWD
jgi:hypothetical protein